MPRGQGRPPCGPGRSAGSSALTPDDARGLAEQGGADEEPGLRSARRAGVHDHVGAHALGGELVEGEGVAQGPERRGGAEGDQEGSPSLGRQPGGGPFEGGRARRAVRDVLEGGAEEPVEQGVGRGAGGRGAVHHQVAPQAQLGGRGGGGPAVIRLHAPGGQEGVRPGRRGPGPRRGRASGPCCRRNRKGWRRRA